MTEHRPPDDESRDESSPGPSAELWDGALRRAFGADRDAGAVAPSVWIAPAAAERELPPTTARGTSGETFPATIDRYRVLGEIACGGIGVVVEVRDEDRRTSGPIRLLVQPPMLVVSTEDGLARIDLRDGELLQPAIPGPGGLRGAAFSIDGVSGYVLREGGRLEMRSAERWGARPASVRQLDVLGEDLAHGPRTGPAFVVVRPAGEPFAPHGRLVFLDEAATELDVDPLGQEVAGRRWAITADGLTAFVAEDNLLVREVDLLSEQSRRQFVAGVPGDRRIVDMVVHEDRLLIATRRRDGGPGALTTLDLTTGHATPIPLSIDPARLAVLGDGTVLVVPESGPVFQALESAILSRVVVPALEVVDAAPVSSGALLLVRSADGHGVVAWNQSEGLTALRLDDVPAARRLVAAGHGVALLLGAPDGSVRRVVLDPLGIETVAGARVEPEAPFAVLP